MPMLVILEPGDEEIYPDPGFPSYKAAIGIAGAMAVTVPLLEKNNSAKTIEHLADVAIENDPLNLPIICLKKPGSPCCQELILVDMGTATCDFSIPTHWKISIKDLTV